MVFNATYIHIAGETVIFNPELVYVFIQDLGTYIH
jgi:hypothetical protein